MAYRSQYGQKGRFRSDDKRSTSSTSRIERHPPHLKGKDIGLYYARKQRERKEARGEVEDMAKDMIEISDDQREQIEKLLGPRLCNLKPDMFGGLVDPSSEFMAAYQRNLHLNAQNRSSIFQNQTLGPVSEKAKLVVERAEHRQNERMVETRRALPSFAVRDKIIQLVNTHSVIVISGETGCGKTTQVPQYLFEEFDNARIVCTQPRRISAITVANRKKSLLPFLVHLLKKAHLCY